MDDDAEHLDIELPDYHFHYCNGDNVTNIIFDEKLKLFIKEMREHLNNKFDKYDKSILFEKQDYAIQYVKTNKSKLTLKNNRLNTMPDMFCINICLFINIDSYSSFEEMDIKSILTNLRISKNKILIDIKKLKLEEIEKYDSKSDMISKNVDNRLSKKGECCCSKKHIYAHNIFYCINENYSCYFGCDCIEKSNIHTTKAINERINKEKDRLKQIEYEERQKMKLLELEVQRKQREGQRKQKEEQHQMIINEIIKQMREKAEQERLRIHEINKQIREKAEQERLRINEINKQIIKLKLENKLSTIIKKKMDKEYKEYNEKCKIIFNKINSESEFLKYYNSQIDGEDTKYYLEKRYLYNWYDYKESIKSFKGKWDNDNKKWYFINKKNYNEFHKSNDISL